MLQAITSSREIEVSEPSGKVKLRRVTPHRLDRAARELGLLTISAKGLMNTAAIGRFLDQVGILSYGAGKLAATAEAISAAAAQCAVLAQEAGLDHESRQGYLELQLRFTEALDRNMELQVQLSGASTVKAAQNTGPAYKPFLPGAQLTPVQINIGQGTVAEKTTVAEKKSEEP
jgi:hypothetical protein